MKKPILKSSIVFFVVVALYLPVAAADEGVIAEGQQNAVATPMAKVQEQAPVKANTNVETSQWDKYFDSFSVSPIYNYMYVKGDRGRFRQDSFMDDQSTGGIENLEFHKKSGDVYYEFEGKAIVNYDYLTRIYVRKKDDFDLKILAKYFRKYWDGSQDKEVFNPQDFALPLGFNDWDEKQLHTDRGNVNVEFGKHVADNARLILGYDLWTRVGRDVLLKGEQAVRTGQNLRALSMRRRVHGASNTFYLRVPFTVNEIHHLEPGISWEIYRDSQYTDSARYTVAGALNQKRDYIDKPEFNDLKFQLKYDSFLTDNVFLHGGYHFNFLENDSVRSEVRPNLAASSTYVNPEVDNYRIANVFSLGTALLDVVRKKGLDMRLGFKAEQASTDAHGSLDAGGAGAIRTSDTKLNEGRFGQALSLTYRGLKNTTMFAGLDMEQRKLNWEETYDARSHESVTVFGSAVNFPTYETDITYIDLLPRAKITHRINSRVKSFLQYRLKAKQRRYDTVNDTAPVFYPGHLGDEDRFVQEVTSDLDLALPSDWHSKLRYQMVLDDIEHDRADDQQEWNRNRFSLSLFGPLGPRVTLFTTGTYEYNRLNTPTDAPGTSRWAPGEGAYDFNGDVFVITVNPTVQVTKRISAFAFYQITDSLGDNNNVLNEASLGANFRISDVTALNLRYSIFNFEDRRHRVPRGSAEGFDDDYYGHGFTISFNQLLC